jgi:hypothetical protein
MKSPQFFC